jgi:hypothetical protein
VAVQVKAVSSALLAALQKDVAATMAAIFVQVSFTQSID